MAIQRGRLEEDQRFLALCNGVGRVDNAALQNAGHAAAHHALGATVIPQSAQVLRQPVAPDGIVDFVFA